MCNHLWQNGSLSNCHLQAAIALYGLENFEYFVIEFVTEKEQLIKEEQKYMDMVPSNQRYNFCPTAGSCLGVVRSAETKAAISNALKGTTRSAETKAAISEAQSESIKGNTNRLGTIHSTDTKAAISAALKGNTNRARCVYVYDSNNVLVETFPSLSAAIKEYKISKVSIYKYLDSKKLWNNLYYFTTTRSVS
jgi:group I intron endonuclease